VFIHGLIYPPFFHSPAHPARFMLKSPSNKEIWMLKRKPKPEKNASSLERWIQWEQENRHTLNLAATAATIVVLFLLLALTVMVITGGRPDRF